jgi:tRNA pseudouridine38-40 synthase
MYVTRRLGFVSYDGSFYHGFAKNNRVSTVQGFIERVLCNTFKISFSDLYFTFSSRTDAGVHALEQPVCFDAPGYFSDEALLRILNYHLPFTIQFRSIASVKPDYNLRNLIQKKEYWYVIATENQGVVLSRYCWVHPKVVSLVHLQQMTELLCGTNDYKSFAKDAKQYDSTICTVHSIEIIPAQNLTKEVHIPIDFPFKGGFNGCIISVTGNRFLHNQVRRMCGCMVHVASQHLHDASPLPCGNFQEFTQHYSDACKIKAPAHGLYLRKVQLDQSTKG